MISNTLASWICAALILTQFSIPVSAQQSAYKSTSSDKNTRLQRASSLQESIITMPLTVEAAVRIGVARNPLTTAGIAGVASAEAAYRSLDAFPSLQLGITRAQGTSTAPTLNGADSDTFIDLGEVFDASGQRRFMAASAKAQWGAARFQLYETKITLEQQIRDAYWSLAASQALTQYGMESFQEAQRVNLLVHTQQKAGAVPQSDVIRSSIDVANAQQAYITAVGAERSALSSLNILLVRSPTRPLSLAGSIETEITSKGDAQKLPDLQSLTKSVLANRPLLKAALEQVHAMEYMLKQTRASRLPDLSVDYERSLQQSTDTVLLTVKFPLFDFGNTHYSIKAAEESRKQAAAQKEQAEQQVIQQIAQAYQDVAQAQTLLASYLTDILKPSITLRDMAQLGYKQGATGILPLIDAETTLRSARTGYINSLLAVHKAEDELIAAIGGPDTYLPPRPPSLIPSFLGRKGEQNR